MALNLLKTEDGSFTLKDDRLDEIYHSIAGAVQESMHVYIQAGYQKLLDKFQRIHILEIGFGTGLNAWLTLLEGQKGKKVIRYYSLEPFPISDKIYTQLNYPGHRDSIGKPEIFEKLHNCPWQKNEKISNHFTLFKDRCSLESYSGPASNFHLVYFDAFSPDVQAELWTLDIFKKIYLMMASESILVTYSAKGKVRRNLQEAGFIVERIKGPPGKREMLRASKGTIMNS